jgi:Bacterial pre-peptidase C-terminal domain
LVAASATSNVAFAVIEGEASPGGNDSLGTAQPLTVSNGTAEVTGAIGSTTYSVSAVPDVDFYSFAATAGDMLTIDINGGIKEGGPLNPIRSVDTVIALFMADGTMLYLNDDADDLDLGSIATNDSRIINAVLPATGTYFVGVTGTGMQGMHLFSDGGLVTGASTADPNTGNGSYTLTIAGVTTPPADTPPADTPPDTPPAEPPVVTTPPPVVAGAQQINIDIRPRQPGVTKIWANTDGKIVVALLSSSSFNALKVDRTSITFGAEGNEASLIRCHSDGVHVNRDRRKDLVCLFDLKKASFEVGDLEGVVKGTVEGKAFEGHAPLKVYQRGKKHKHRHDNDRWERHADRR